ncbi:MAG: 30S ribosomal protein S8 [Alphaproteobacteria bacterium]|nr:30S ribosomal protein S8 [Alphaproteobacteria bacterium]
MSMSDPLGDMLTRIRNGQRASLKQVICPASKMRESVLSVLKSSGYIRGYKEEASEQGHKNFVIDLKYDEGTPVIRELHRVSKPGRRIYSAAQAIPRYYNGLGITIVSTPRGVMADQQARDENVGGELLCQVF